jgi:hypothetical protein
MSKSVRAMWSFNGVLVGMSTAVLAGLMSVSGVCRVGQRTLVCRCTVPSVAAAQRSNLDQSRPTENVFRDRFSSRSIEVMYFARHEVTEAAASSIEPVHIFAAILQVDPLLVQQSIPTDSGLERLRSLVLSLYAVGPRIEPHVGVPLAPGADQVIERAIAIADRFGDPYIEPLHLLAALVEDESSDFVKALGEAGLTGERVAALLLR